MLAVPATLKPQAWCCMQTGWWAGNTLLIDFPFPAFPDNMGHWAEVLLPVYSTLLTGTWRKHVQGTSHHIDRLLLINVRRDQLQVRQSPIDRTYLPLDGSQHGGTAVLTLISQPLMIGYGCMYASVTEQYSP